MKGIPVNGQKIRYLFLTAGKRDDIGLDKIKVLRPSSRAQAGVHRTPAFKLFESSCAFGEDDIGLDEIMERHRRAGAGGAHSRRI